jgi:hypothetical protein
MNMPKLLGIPSISKHPLGCQGSVHEKIRTPSPTLNRNLIPSEPESVQSSLAVFYQIMQHLIIQKDKKTKKNKKTKKQKKAKTTCFVIKRGHASLTQRPISCFLGGLTLSFLFSSTSYVLSLAN